MIYEECTILVSQELWADATNYYTEKDIRDLVYSGLDPQYFLAFLSEMRIKDNGKHSSVSNISKFYDALKFGSKISKRLLSVTFLLKSTSSLHATRESMHLPRRMGKQMKWRLMPSAALFSSC